MQLILNAFWVLTVSIFIWANLLAQGKRIGGGTKIPFLLYQKILALILIIVIVFAIILGQTFYLYLYLAELFLLLLFYLQPTPRTSRYLLYIFLVANLIFLFFRALIY